MAYVLIVVAFLGGGPTVSMQLFVTQQRCEAAAQTIHDLQDGYGRLKTACVPYGGPG